MTTDASRPTPEGRLAEVLTAAEARWARHVDVLDWQPGYQIRGPEDSFTPAQEYGHLGHWLAYAAAHVRARLEGLDRPAAIDETGPQNDAWAVEDARLTHEEAKALASAARQQYIDLVQRMGRDDERFTHGVAGNLVSHLDQHFGYMLTGMWEHESLRWERLTAILDANPRGALHQGDDGVGWDATAVYAHLHRWMWVQFPRIEAFLATGEVPDLDATTDQLNARWMAEDCELPFEDARRLAYRSRDRFLRVLRDVPIEQWNARLVSLCAGNSLGHYQEHLAWIEGGS